MKKVTSILMAFVLMLTLIPTAWAEGGSAGAGTDVAMIGDVTYETLADAVAKADNGATIQLLKDTAEDITIPASKTITIDLNGKKITNKSANTITVEEGAALTINGTGTVDNVTHGKAAIYNKGAVTLNGGTFERSAEAGKDSGNNGGNSYYTILNHGEMTVGEGVTVNNKGHHSSLFSNGYYSYETKDGVEKPTLTINGGMFDGGLNTIKNDDDGILTINNGTFKNYTQAAFQNHGTATVLNGSFIAESVYSIDNCGCDATHDPGKLTVSGGTFKGTLYVRSEYSDVAITGGSLTGSIVKTGGKLSITGGTFSSDPTAYLAAGYTASKGSDGMYTLVSNHVAQIGDTKYVTLADAVAVGGDIKLLKDVTIDKYIEVRKAATIDLGGHKLTSPSSMGFDVYADLTLKNGSMETFGWAVWVQNGAKLVVDKDVQIKATSTAGNQGGITVQNSGSAVTLYGKVEAAGGAVVSGIGNKTDGGVTINIEEGAEVKSTAVGGVGIYYPNTAELNIKGGTISGSTGVYIKSGKTVVTGGTITGTGEKRNYEYKGDGCTATGSALVVDSCNYPGGNPVVEIKGGVFNSEKADAVASYCGDTVEKALTSFITGGTFNTNPKDYVPTTGYTVAKKGDVYTVAEKDKKEDGTVAETSAVKLEVPATSGNAVINTTVDQNDIETNKELTVTNGKTAVTINQAGVAAIGTGANLNLSIKADSKTPESANTAAYNKAMAGKDANSAVVVNISLTSGANKVFTTDVAGAYALVTVPYSTDKADKLTVYYLNGSDATALTKVVDAAASGAALNTFSYDATNKLITLKLPHFSEYLISTTATRSVVHHYGGSGTTTTTGTKTNSPGTFDAGVGIYAVSAILSVTGMAWVGTKQRKH